MKQRKIVLPLIATIALTAAGYLGMKSSAFFNDNTLISENIEALTQAENPNGYKMQCTTAIQYTGGYSMPLYCRTCSFRYGYVATGSNSLCP